MIKYIVCDSGSSASRLMFYDIKTMTDAIETSSIFNIPNPVLKLLNKVHMSGKINRKIQLPVRKIWDKYYITEIAKRNLKDQFIVVMTNISVRKFRLEYLQSLEKQPNVCLVLVAVDSFVDKELCPLDIMAKVKFDLVYSFDKGDCLNYGLQHTQSLYSKKDNVKALSGKSDLFFVGRAKDRFSSLCEIVNKANTRDLKCNFQILGVKNQDRVNAQGITYLDTVKPYDDVLPMILSSKCLLDIVQTGQDGLTMRVYESIFYNKKLITNNPNVRYLPYYNLQYMQIIDDIGEIDFDFISKDETVNYDYLGDYSPVRFLEVVKEELLHRGVLQ